MKTLWTVAMAALLHLAGTLPMPAQTDVGADQIIEKFRGLTTEVEIDPAEIQQEAAERTKPKRGSGSRPLLRAQPEPPQPPLLPEALGKQPQLTVNLEFYLDTPIMRPQAYRTIAAMADALFDPALLDTKLLVIAHTEAGGKRPQNLELSQRRAAAVREALVTTYRVSPQRVFALGVGEEVPQNTGNPKDAANRRIQFVAIGKREPAPPPAAATPAKQPAKQPAGKPAR